ncbi:MucBP domain-containing protein [Enterococcus sp. DIV0170]|uniref:MucBP domain-containing protein n=1 Tax=Enterococcus sp. DIV0170 TaxID=2774642 RepID=UPI003F245952
MKKVKLFIFLVLSLCFSVLIATGEEAHAADMHRLYNPNSGEHFYTATTGEKNHLVKVGWRYEGIGWIAPSSGHAVYRLYNPNAGDHHYTMNANEKNHLVKVGWRYEGIGWYSDTKMTVPLYRAYNPNAKAGSHNYTVNYVEQKNLLRVGWRDEGIAWYGIKKTTPVTKYTVTVRHIGSDGKTLKSATTQVEKGKSYTAKAASFSGYTLKGSSSQTVTVNGNKTITFNYTKNTVAPTKYTVTVKYVDIAGKEIEKATTASVEKGKSYTATAKSIAGYTAKTPTSQKITVNGNQTVTFKYTKNATPGTKYIVTVKYVDKDGKNIRPASRQTVEEGKTFTAEAQEIPDYTVQGTGSQVIKSVNKDETIIFVYTSNSIVEFKITVKYVDEGGNSIKTATTHTIGYGEQFSMTAPTITGYTVKAADKTKDIASVNKNETVTFTYTKNKYVITAKYVDEGGNSIKSTTTQTIEHGNRFTMTAPTITGYTVKAADKTKDIASVSKNETVTFTYTKNKYVITAKYVDEGGNSIKTATTHTIGYGEQFSMTAPTITGYTVKAADKTKDIASVSKNETVTFTYTKNKYVITAKYVDEGGNSIKSTTTQTIEHGNRFTMTAPTITGYTVKAADKTKDIASVSKNETVTFTYTKNKYTITAKYVDESGNSIKNATTHPIEYGNLFSMTAPAITGYTVKTADKTKNIASVSKNETVTFTYTKNTPEKYTITVKYVDQAGKEIKTATTANVEKGQPYSITAPTIDGYTVVAADKTKSITSVSKAETLTIRYTKNAIEKYTITVKYVDIENSPIKTSTTASIEKGQPYTATAPTIEGYTLKGNAFQTISSVTSDATITFVYNNLAFDRITLHATVDGNIVKSVTFKVKPGEIFNPSLDKLELDPNKYDLSLRPLYPVVTGKGGRELSFDFEVTLFKNYLTDAEKQIMKETILQKVNDLRTNLIVPVGMLTEHSTLNTAATVRSKELKILFEHVRPDTRQYYTAITDAGLEIGGIRGENIWRIQGSRETSGKVMGEKAFEKWKESSGHYATMVDPNYNYIGIGIYNYGNDTYCSLLVIRK